MDIEFEIQLEKEFEEKTGEKAMKPGIIGGRYYSIEFVNFLKEKMTDLLKPRDHLSTLALCDRIIAVYNSGGIGERIESIENHENGDIFINIIAHKIALYEFIFNKKYLFLVKFPKLTDLE